MSSVLFGLTVIAFAVLAYWTYKNDRAGAESGLKGLLGMRAEAPALGAATPKAPKWSVAVRREPAEGRFSKRAVSPRRQPKWQRKTKRPV